MSYTISIPKEIYEQKQREYEATLKLIQDDDSDEEEPTQDVLESVLRHFPPHSRRKRRGPCAHYGRAKVRKLFEYYFVDKLTVREACTVLNIKERTAYNYIRKLKAMNLPNIFSKRAGFSREDQLEGLTAQMAAAKFF